MPDVQGGRQADPGNGVRDHIERHGGDPVRFWHGPFQSLCAPCHSSEKQRQELSLGG
jgi:hypothetical protein